MRSRSALVAGLVACVTAWLAAVPRDARGDDPRQARADDPRDVFGLPRQLPPSAQADCGDGLAFDCALATDPLGDATPYGLSTWLPASYLQRLPVGTATHDRVASYALGASSDGAGPVFGGATGVENRWTIDGAPADDPRTGAAGTRIPLTFLDGLAVSAGGFSARDRASTGGTIDARLRRGTTAHEVAADAWTQLTLAPRDPPTAIGSYTVRQLSIASRPEATASVVATGPIGAPGSALGGTAWYAAGLAPTLATTGVSWQAARQVDADGDGVPDGRPGDLAVQPIERTSARTFDYRVPAMARAGLDRGPHHVELTLIGERARDAQFLANATLPAAGIDRQTTTGDAIATWRGTWAATHARVQAAWHHSSSRESAHDAAAAGVPQLLSAYVPGALPDDPALAAACNDAAADDPAKLIANCPVAAGAFASGGAGLLTDVTGDRPSVTADLAHRLGDHVIRAGATFEHTWLSTASSFTGGEQDRSRSAGEISRRRFYTGSCTDDVSQPCAAAAQSQLTYRTSYAAAYIEDTFAPSPRVSIDAGLRWELMRVGPNLQFSRQLAPRLGITWDPLGGGSSRLWASYGRTFAMLPAGLGATVIQRDATVEDAGASRTHDAGAAFPIAAGIEPIVQDEVTLGAEVALVGALRATLWGHGRLVRHGLETASGEFTNPGSAGTSGDAGEIPATRETEIVAFSLEMRKLAQTAIRAGVSWGRTVGTWAGPYDPRQGVNLLQGSDWDAGASNLYGPLPTDQGGRGFVEAERRGTLATLDVSVATRLAIGSGTPRSVLAQTSDGIVALLPRGAAGRNPVITQANLRLSARWHGLTATLDVINLFDRRDAIRVDEVYTTDAVRPISGGSYEDLAHLKSDTGRTVRRQPAFQLASEFQPPLAIALGVHTAF